MSRNKVTIQQLNLCCRHYFEMLEVGMTENYAIRTLELISNSYAKYLVVGNTSPDHVDQYILWSTAAIQYRLTNKDYTSSGKLRVEHGTPKRQFSRLILKAFGAGSLTEIFMENLCRERWKVAVITTDEDKLLSQSKLRSHLAETAHERWEMCGIEVVDIRDHIENDK